MSTVGALDRGGEWDTALRTTGLIGLLALPVVLLVPGAAGLVVFGFITLWVNGPLSPLLPATYEPVLAYFGRIYPPLLIAIVGTVVTLAIEYVNYKLHRRLLRTTAGERVSRSGLAEKVSRLFARRPAFTIWLCAWSPLPYWPVRILSPMAGVPIETYLVATLLGRFPRLWLVASVGAWLNLPLSVLSGIAGGSILLAIGILAWSRR